MIVDCCINRDGIHRTIDTTKVAKQVIEYWVNSSDGSQQSLVDTLEKTLKELVIALCDA